MGLEAACGGKGVCGKCRVRVEGALPPASPREAALLQGSPEHTRLACQCGLPQGGAVWIPEESRPQAQVILTTGHQVELELEPVVRAHGLTVAPPCLDDPSSAATRLERALPPEEPRAEGGGLCLPLSVMKNLPHALADQEGRVTMVVRDYGQVLDITPGHGAPCLGLAVDVGTTTLVAYLVDLSQGRVLAVEAAMNPQVAYGDDVISRIAWCGSRRGGGELLAGLVRDALAQMAARACASAGVGAGSGLWNASWWAIPPCITSFWVWTPLAWPRLPLPPW